MPSSPTRTASASVRAPFFRGGRCPKGVRGSWSLAATLLALISIGSLGPIDASPAGAQSEGLRILVTNDDGYESQGLRTLVAELAKIAEVVVCAPDGNRSGASQSMAISSAITAKPVEIEGASEAWAVDTTPAGAADLGVSVLGAERPFDLVVSGINRGANVGDVSHVSGTVGAAMQAASLGVPAIAVSQDIGSQDYALAARYTRQLIETLREQGFSEGVVLSINVPAAAVREVAEGGSAESVVAPMGGSYIVFGGYDGADSTQPDATPGTRTYRVRFGLLSESTGLEGMDTGAYLDGKITVTPLRFDWTDTAELERLRADLIQPSAP